MIKIFRFCVSFFKFTLYAIISCFTIYFIRKITVSPKDGNKSTLKIDWIRIKWQYTRDIKLKRIYKGEQSKHIAMLILTISIYWKFFTLLSSFWLIHWNTPVLTPTCRHELWVFFLCFCITTKIYMLRRVSSDINNSCVCCVLSTDRCWVHIVYIGNVGFDFLSFVFNVLYFCNILYNKFCWRLLQRLMTGREHLVWHTW